MVNKDKIILMAKMAVQDKRHGDSDRKVFSYYRRDYIYRKNMWTRLYVGIGAGFLLVFYWLYQIFVYGVNLQELDIRQSVTDSVLFLLAMMALYTLIGTIQGTHQYYRVQKRMGRYMAMMKRLEYIPDSPPESSNSDLVYTNSRRYQRDYELDYERDYEPDREDYFQDS